IDGVRWQKSWKITTAADKDPTDDIDAILKRLNALRKEAGLEPVELDLELSKSCQAHARYLSRNLLDQPNLALREEDPALPGSTPEGRKVAPRVNVQRGLVGAGMIDFMFGV